MPDAAEAHAGRKGSLVSPEVFLEFLDLLDEHKLEYVVHGGWAVEALTGVERPHGDIDMAAPLRTMPEYKKALAPYIVKGEPRKLKFKFKGADAEVTFFKQYRNGDIAMKRRNHWYVLPPPDRVSVKGFIRGREVHVSSPVTVSVVIHVRSYPNPVPEKNKQDLAAMDKIMTPEERESVKDYVRRSHSRLAFLRTILGF